MEPDETLVDDATLPALLYKRLGGIPLGQLGFKKAPPYRQRSLSWWKSSCRSSKEAHVGGRTLGLLCLQTPVLPPSGAGGRNLRDRDRALNMPTVTL